MYIISTFLQVAVLLRTHEKDWITEEKFMETLEELVY
jgi:hypothetical protein